MALFSQKTATPAQVSGIDLRCEICNHDRFFERQAQLNTAVATFFSLDWANRTARCLVCERCGYVHWFLPSNEQDATVD